MCSARNGEVAHGAAAEYTVFERAAICRYWTGQSWEQIQRQNEKFLEMDYTVFELTQKNWTLQGKSMLRKRGVWPVGGTLAWMVAVGLARMTRLTQPRTHAARRVPRTQAKEYVASAFLPEGACTMVQTIGGVGAASFNRSAKRRCYMDTMLGGGIIPAMGGGQSSLQTQQRMSLHS